MRITLPPVPLPLDKPLTLSSFNIRGFKDKREDLELYLEVERIDIIGLQETNRKNDNWRLHLHQFNCVEITSGGPGKRGIALAVRKGINAFPVGQTSPYFIFVRILGNGGAKPFIVGTVYLPHRHVNIRDQNGIAPHQQAKQDLRSEIERLRRRYPLDALIVMGDFNRNIPEMETLCNRLQGMSLSRMQDRTETFRINRLMGRGRSIDHFIITSRDSHLLKDPLVDNTIDLSDHFPIRASLYLSTGANEPRAQPPLLWHLPRLIDPLSISAILRSNGFDALRDLENSEGPPREEHLHAHVNVKVRRFIKLCNDIGDDLHFRKRSKINRTHPTSPEHRMACIRRRELYVSYKTLRRMGDPRNAEIALEAYRVFRKETSDLAKEARRLRWDSIMVKANQNLSENPRELWS